MKKSVCRSILALVGMSCVGGPAGAQVPDRDSAVRAAYREMRRHAIRDLDGKTDLSVNLYRQPGVRFRTPGLDAGEGMGAELTQADYSIRVQLNLPNDRGLVVTNVVPDGPAAKVGLQENDILLTLGETPLNEPKDLTVALKTAAGRKEGADAETPLKLSLIRGGKPLTIQVKPESHVTVAAVAPEAKAEFFIGVPVNPVDETLRSHLDLPADTGLIVGDVLADSPAAKAKIVKGDILVSFDGNPLPNVETLRDKVQVTEGKPAQIKLLRQGKPVEVTVSPERRKPDPEPTGGVARHGAGRIVNGAPMVWEIPQVNRLFLRDGRPLTLSGPIDLGPPAAPDLARKIDDLTAQVQALTKAVEELRKQGKSDRESK